MRRVLIMAISAAALGSAGAWAQDDALSASASFINTEGEAVGSATLTETPNGVLVRMELSGLEPGGRAMHFHEVGECEPPFESAGGHFNPTGSDHGYLHESGPHAGDLPNITVAADGTAMVEAIAPMVTLAEGGEGSLIDGDGTAIIIHAGLDDYESQPSGAAGDRSACAVIEANGAS